MQSIKTREFYSRVREFRSALPSPKSASPLRPHATCSKSFSALVFKRGQPRWYWGASRERNSGREGRRRGELAHADANRFRGARQTLHLVPSLLALARQLAANFGICIFFQFVCVRRLALSLSFILIT